MAITLDGTSGITTPGITASSGDIAATTLSVDGNNINATNGINFRNRIINGDMRIDQRNAGASVTVSSNNSAWSADRFRFDSPADQSMTFQQQTSVVPPGFTYALKVTAGTATSNTNNQPALCHFIEGYNTADFNSGTASAKTITLSFQVYSSLTGTFGVCFENNAGNRAYIASYTINIANTWETKTITITCDTSGTWNTTNLRGMSVFFDLGYGTNFSAAASSAWANLSSVRGLTGGVKLAANTGATWYITGVQLEVGSVATPFERRPYGMELALCQRYYAKSFLQGTAPAQNVGSFAGATRIISVNPSTRVLMDVYLPVVMRAAPTVTFFNPSAANAQARDASASADCSSTGIYTVGDRNFVISTIGSGSSTQGNGLSVHWTANIEL